MRANFSAPQIAYDRDGKPASFWGLKGSASLRGKELTLTAVNPNVKEPAKSQIVIHGAKVISAEATVLSASDIHAHNTFEDRQAVVPKTQKVAGDSQPLVFNFPAASVTKLTLQLA